MKRFDVNSVMIRIITLMFAVCFISMPMAFDDYWYSSYIFDYKEKLRSGFPLREIFETWKYHWQADNGRLANVIFVPFLTIPRWVGALLGSILLLFSLLGGLN